MTTKTPIPHLLETTDPDRNNPHMPRSCNRCGLPETRTDVHTLPDVRSDIRELERRRLGEPAEQETDADRED